MTNLYGPPTGLGATPSGSPVGTCADLSWSAPTLLNPPQLYLPMNGTNGGVTTTDASGNSWAVQINAASGATLSNVSPKFAGDLYLNVPAFNSLFSYVLAVPFVANDALDIFTTNSWAFECFVKVEYSAAAFAFPIVGYSARITGAADGGFIVSAEDNNNGTLTLTVDATNTHGGTPITATVSAVEASWHHVAVSWDGTTGRLFFDGNVVATTVQWPASSYSAPSGTPCVVLGSDMQWNGGNQAGGIEQFIVWNVAKYTANFTPPAAPLAINPAFYDVYRDGISVNVGSGTTYHDCPPGGASGHMYTVAASDGTNDVSDPSTPPAVVNALTGTIPNFLQDEAIYGGYFGGVLNLVEFVYLPERPPFLEPGATNSMIINRYKQEPTDSRQRGVDYSFFLVPGETITGVTVQGISAQGVLQADTDPVVTPLVISNLLIDPLGLKFAYTVSGGQDGIEYTVQFLTTTTLQSSNVEEIFSINVLIEDSFP